MEDVHQQASLTAGTIAYNDELSTDFRHLDGLEMIRCKGATKSRGQLQKRGIRELAGGRWGGVSSVGDVEEVARRGKDKKLRLR